MSEKNKDQEIIIVNGKPVSFRVINVEGEADKGSFIIEHPDYGRITWIEDDDTEYVAGEPRVIPYGKNNPPPHSGKLFDFDYRTRKKYAETIETLPGRMEYWRNCLKELKSSKDYHYYKNFKRSGWNIKEINVSQDPRNMLLGLRTNYSYFGRSIKPEHKEYIDHIGVLLHTYLHLTVLDFIEKVEDDIAGIKDELLLAGISQHNVSEADINHEQPAPKMVWKGTKLELGIKAHQEYKAKKFPFLATAIRANLQMYNMKADKKAVNSIRSALYKIGLTA